MSTDFVKIPTKDYRKKQAIENSLYWCGSCNEFKTRIQFHNSVNHNFGVFPECKDCRKKARKINRDKYLKDNIEPHPKKCILCNSLVKIYNVKHYSKPLAHTKRWKKCKACSHTFTTVELNLNFKNTDTVETMKLLLAIENNGNEVAE